MENKVGKLMFYTEGGKAQAVVCKSTKYNSLLKKQLYYGSSTEGREVLLTEDEVIIWKDIKGDDDNGVD